MDLRLVVVALCVALAASACSGSDKKPSTLPPLTSTPTASAAPSVPPFPATKQGAAEFVGLWARTLNAAGRTGQTTVLRGLSDSACASCNGLISLIDNAWASGRLEGGDLTLRNLVTADVSATAADLTATFSFSAERRFDRQGHLIHSEPATTEGEQIRLRRINSGWLMRSITELK
jgi:hypothetical protein